MHKSKFTRKGHNRNTDYITFQISDRQLSLYLRKQYNLIVTLLYQYKERYDIYRYT